LHKIDFIEKDGAMEISFQGNLTIQNNNALLATFIECIEKNPKKIAINCQFMDSIDSSGLGAFISMSKMAKSSGVSLYICELNPRINSLFDMSNLDSIFDIITINEFRELSLP